ncbi:MAG: glycosyltransferase [Candidatus Dependentiae bacterium]|nr:glycosyltransferase [Candidatus Dependentiae bacterium]
MKISIIIPAHNEEKRIRKTIETYHEFFSTINLNYQLNTELIVVLNGCTDNTLEVVQECAYTRPNIIIIDIIEAGKGLAVKTGFADALTRDNDLIGFVDADMATSPRYFYDLITHIHSHDGVIASRYMPGAYISPHRPFVKKWGRKLVYNSLVRHLFKLNFYDYQCGAKLFKRTTIEKVTPYLTAAQWAFDVELLYLCSLLGFAIHEMPTTWFDQAGSKLKIMSSGSRMLTSLFDMKKRHKVLEKMLTSK